MGVWTDLAGQPGEATSQHQPGNRTPGLPGLGGGRSRGCASLKLERRRARPFTFKTKTEFRMKPESLPSEGKLVSVSSSSSFSSDSVLRQTERRPLPAPSACGHPLRRGPPLLPGPLAYILPSFHINTLSPQTQAQVKTQNSSSPTVWPPCPPPTMAEPFPSAVLPLGGRGARRREDSGSQRL